MKTEKEIVTPWAGINSMQSNRWCCIQDVGNGRQWFYEPSVSYTRKESIRMLIGDGKLTWRQLKCKYGWRCSKVVFNLIEI